MSLSLLCIKIFITRIVDVSLGTFVTVLTVKNKRLIATLIGFIDVIIWFMVVREALNAKINSIWIALSYAGGYAAGTFIGATLSNVLINGKISVQVVLNYLASDEIEKIRDAGFAVSQVECTGKDNVKKSMLFIEAEKAPKRFKKSYNINRWKCFYGCKRNKVRWKRVFQINPCMPL